MVKVKRYPHTATISYDTEGKLVKGEWIEGEKKEIALTGRYEPVSTGHIVTKFNSQGDEKQVHGYFYTNTMPSNDMHYQKLSIPQIGIDVNVICWEPYQTYSIVCV